MSRRDVASGQFVPGPDSGPHEVRNLDLTVPNWPRAELFDDQRHGTAIRDLAPDAGRPFDDRDHRDRGHQLYDPPGRAPGVTE